MVSIFTSLLSRLPVARTSETKADNLIILGIFYNTLCHPLEELWIDVWKIGFPRHCHLFDDLLVLKRNEDDVIMFRERSIRLKSKISRVNDVIVNWRWDAHFLLEVDINMLVTGNVTAMAMPSSERWPLLHLSSLSLFLSNHFLPRRCKPG